MNGYWLFAVDTPQLSSSTTTDIRLIRFGLPGIQTPFAATR